MFYKIHIILFNFFSSSVDHAVLLVGYGTENGTGIAKQIHAFTFAIRIDFLELSFDSMLTIKLSFKNHEKQG